MAEERSAPGGEPPIVRIEHSFAEPPERLFEAFTRPDILAQWWGPPGVESSTAEIDLRVGGRYRVVSLASDGSRHAVGGTYREIEPPARLVFTWAWEGMDAPESVVRIELNQEAGGTRLVLEHDGLPPPLAEQHRRGWMHVLGRLGNLLGEG